MKYIDPNALDVVTVKGKEYRVQSTEYRVYTYEGPIAKIENALVVISYEVSGDSFKKPIFIMSTNIDLDTKTIIEYYSNRWTIETSYKYLKSNLGFDKYRVRSLLSIERYFLIVFLAINFLEIFKVTHKDLIIKTLGEAIEYHRGVSTKEFVLYIYHNAKSNVPIADIYSRLHIA